MMRFLIISTWLLVAACSACAAPARFPNTPQGEGDAMASLLDQLHASRKPSSGQTIVVVDELLSGAGVTGEQSQDHFCAELVSSAPAAVPHELIADFCGKLVHSQPTWPQLRALPFVRFISQQELSSIFSCGPHCDGWKQFRQKYPNSFIIHLSRLGISQTGDLVMIKVFSTADSLACDDAVYVWKRVGSHWSEEPVWRLEQGIC